MEVMCDAHDKDSAYYIRVAIISLLLIMCVTYFFVSLESAHNRRTHLQDFYNKIDAVPCFCCLCRLMFNTIPLLILYWDCID